MFNLHVRMGAFVAVTLLVVPVTIRGIRSWALVLKLREEILRYAGEPDLGYEARPAYGLMPFNQPCINAEID